MKRLSIVSLAVASLFCSSCLVGTNLGGMFGSGKIIDHADADVDGITDAMTEAARQRLRIVYWHTSHGSQLTTGLSPMDAFYGDTGRYDFGGLNGPFFDDRYSEESIDLGNPNRTNFIQRTRDFLEEVDGINVVMWSWCGQADTTAANIDIYLNGMSTLESEYPDVVFVYMTGHSVGTGESGDLHLRNQQIRDYCVANGKWLYDFYDIECYDPDGAYFGDKNVDDACNYTGGNWATEWQNAHPGQWWDCSSAHSRPLNANRKAKAVW